MRRPQGYAIITGPHKTREFDTVTCCHCSMIHHVTKDDAGGFCRLCMRNTCAECADKGCYPFARKLVERERRDRMLRAVGV